MPPLAVALALTAAFFHATWNLLLARARDRERGHRRGHGVRPDRGPADRPVRLALRGQAPSPMRSSRRSSSLPTSRCWRGPTSARNLSLIYPIARGLAPVFVLILGVVLLGSAPSQVQALGILIVGMGVILVRGLRAPASLVDAARAAVRHRPPPRSPRTRWSTSRASSTRIRSRTWLSWQLLAPGPRTREESPHAGACRGCGPPPRPLFSSGGLPWSLPMAWCLRH